MVPIRRPIEPRIEASLHRLAFGRDFAIVGNEERRLESPLPNLAVITAPSLRLDAKPPPARRHVDFDVKSTLRLTRPRTELINDLGPLMKEACLKSSITNLHAQCAQSRAILRQTPAGQSQASRRGTPIARRLQT